MPKPSTSAARDTSISTYRAKRDFSVTAEPSPDAARAPADAPIFVVQKHAATRLHYDFRLEHGGVLWSWAVPRGPSLDPHDKRLAVRTEDHPIAYADFSGVIPAGNYGAGLVETWDRGTWHPLADADAALAKGEMKFELEGMRLHGRFVLIRLKPRPNERGENWLLIKEHDDQERAGVDAITLEATPLPKVKARRAAIKPSAREPEAEGAPTPGAVRGPMQASPAPQLATMSEEPPVEGNWISEVKFDGYRLLAERKGGAVRLLTRNGHDWTVRLPAVARAIGRMAGDDFLIDGELVALREDGVSSFPDLQAALSDGHDDRLFFYAFDILHKDGWDLRKCKQIDRKTVLSGIPLGRGAVRYSDHMHGRLPEMRRQACGLGLEGIICKREDAPYAAGRNKSWLKLKCQGREEFVVVGFTPPGGSRQGFGALHVGYHDEDGAWQYAGAVGTGFSDKELASLRTKLDALRVEAPPEGMAFAGDPLDTALTWVKPELIAEVQFIGWSGAGRVRHAAYLGLREDKAVAEIVRALADPDAPRTPVSGRKRATIVRASAPSKGSAAPRMKAAPKQEADVIENVRLTHADRELWPGISKRDLAEYWLAVAPHALPGIAHRPLALVRCPDGAAGEQFFQKHARPGFPKELRGGNADGAPFLAMDGVSGLLACAQVAAIELHTWGSAEADPTRPDRLVFDLDPGEGTTYEEVVAAAHDTRARLKAIGLESFCRTTGGNGLHVVAPVTPKVEWDAARAWCRAFAESMASDAPDRYVARLPKVERRGKILVDWLRNGLGSTAVASFSPRARPGATVSTPVTWKEVVPSLDPKKFTVATVPKRLAGKGAAAWAGFDDVAQIVPDAVTPATKQRKR